MQVLRFYSIKSNSTGNIKRLADSILIPDESHLSEMKDNPCTDMDIPTQKPIIAAMKKSQSVPVALVDNEGSDMHGISIS